MHDLDPGDDPSFLWKYRFFPIKIQSLPYYMLILLPISWGLRKSEKYLGLIA